MVLCRSLNTTLTEIQTKRIALATLSMGAVVGISCLTSMLHFSIFRNIELFGFHKI